MTSKPIHELVHRSLKKHGLLEQTLHVFDMDNTLVNTKDIVKQAYLKAGVEELKFEQNWGNPASMWLTPEISAKKAEEYEKILRDRSNGKLFTQLSFLANSPDLRGHCFTLTSASSRSYDLLQRYAGHLPPLMAASCLLAHKIGKLRSVQQYFMGKVIYYDDDIHTIENMRQSFRNNPGFDGVLAHFVNGQGVTFFTVSAESEASWTV